MLRNNHSLSTKTTNRNDLKLSTNGVWDVIAIEFKLYAGRLSDLHLSYIFWKRA